MEGNADGHSGLTTCPFGGRTGNGGPLQVLCRGCSQLFLQLFWRFCGMLPRRIRSSLRAEDEEEGGG